MLGFQPFQACPNQEEYFVPLVNDTLVDHEIIIGDVTNSEILHHASSIDDIPSSSTFKEDGVHKGIDHYLQNLFKPPFPLKEEDAINDTHSYEIIFETLHYDMMVMLGSQTMTHVLCQVFPYPLLEKNGEHI